MPGPSALLAALVASGLSAERFTFYGFLPRKGGDRTRLLREVADSPHTGGVAHQSPQRIGALLEDLLPLAGAERRVAVARELTKLHEECYRAPLGEAVERFRERAVKGEVVLVVEGNPAPGGTEEEAEAAARTLAEALLAQGLAPARSRRSFASGSTSRGTTPISWCRGSRTRGPSRRRASCGRSAPKVWWVVAGK